MTLIDTHAHISYEDYSDRIEEVIQAAEDNGVEKIISIGVDLSSSEECLKLAEKYPSVFATCGIHPHEAGKAPKRYLYELEEFTHHTKVVAIGEIGLDYHYDFSDRKIQRRVYHEQLEMAKSLDLPAVVHCRESDDDILDGIVRDEISNRMMTEIIRSSDRDLKISDDDTQNIEDQITTILLFVCIRRSAILKRWRKITCF